MFDDKAQGFRDIFLFLAFAHLILVPITMMIPDSAKSRSIERLALAREQEEVEPAVAG